MKPFHAIAARLMLAGCLLTSLGAAAAPQLPAAQRAHELTAVDAEAWLDGLMPSALHTAQAPGAVVVIVRDGKVLLEKGYGFSDMKKRIPVDPRDTLFRPGSTSKLFTWTAVMQLVESGKLNLDADLNQYLDFKIPARNGKPITLRHVMTHTSGFEEAAKDLVTFNEAPLPLGEVLRRHIPRRFADAGSTSGYSNYGAALAAYVVERVSGQPFDDYIEQHIFAPLAMNSSTFRQPPPPALLARMSTGYENKDKPGLGFEVINPAPAGSMSASGDDMARFMIAHLQDGLYQDQRILKTSTAQQMHNTVTRLFPDLNGIALGFYEQNINGRRVIAHAGDLNYFHTDLALFLDEHVGVFISVNALGKDGMGEMIRDSLFREFADRYYPADEPMTAIAPALAREHAKLIAGNYIGTRRADSTFLSIVSLIGPKAVIANADGTITTTVALEPQTYAEVKPFLWREVGGHDRLQAIVRDGKVVRWSTSKLAFGFDFEPADGALARMGLELPLCYAAVAVLFFAALAWPGAALVRRRYRAPLGYTGRRSAAYHLLGLAAVLALVTIGIWAAFFSAVSDSQPGHLALMLHVAQFAALLSFGGGWLVAAWNLVLAVSERRTWNSLAWSAAQLAAFTVVLWIGAHYNMIDFSPYY